MRYLFKKLIILVIFGVGLIAIYNGVKSVKGEEGFSIGSFVDGLIKSDDPVGDVKQTVTNNLNQFANGATGKGDSKKEEQNTVKPVGTQTFQENTGEKKEGLDGPYLVEKVVDGDTIKINIDGSARKIRFIGVDTPESVASQEYLDKTGKENTEEGKTASDFTKALLKQKNVYLEYDVQKTDKYDRILAYVWTDIDGEFVMVNRYLLQEGYAQVMTIQPNSKYADEFYEEQVKAREAKKGLWAVYDDVSGDSGEGETNE